MRLPSARGGAEPLQNGAVAPYPGVVPPSGGLTIGQVSGLLGVPVPTLRSWQERYAVGIPERTPGGHRRYRPDDVELLQALSAAVTRGVAPRTAAQALRRRQDGALPLALLGRLLDRATALDQPGLVRCLDEVEASLGLEATVDQVLLPCLREVGRRWELGVLDVAGEHLATTAARAWVARRLGASALRQAAPVVLAAAADNRHTVALEAFGLLLDRRGWPTVQLGADTPSTSVLVSVQGTGAQAVVITAQQVSRRRGAVEALRLLRTATGVRLYFAGGAFEGVRQRRDVPGTYLGDVLPEAADVVEAGLLGG